MVGNDSRILSSRFDGAVSGTADHTGGLVCANMSQIRHSQTSGSVATTGGHASRVGGLAGSNTGIIYASCSTSTVTATPPSGLAGWWAGGPERRPLRQGPGDHRRQLPPGRRQRPGRRGRLVGENYARILISYSTGEVHKHGGQYAVVGGLVGWHSLNNNDPTVYYSVTQSYWDNATTNWKCGWPSLIHDGVISTVSDESDRNNIAPQRAAHFWVMARDTNPRLSFFHLIYRLCRLLDSVILHLSRGEQEYEKPSSPLCTPPRVIGECHRRS